MKIPKQLIVKFLENNFEVKKTSDPSEVRVNSIFKEDKKFHVYINLDKSCFSDYKNNNQSGGMDWFISEFLDINRNEVFPYLVKEYGFQGMYSIIENIKKEEEPNTIIDDFLKNENIVWFNTTEKLGAFGKKALKYIEDRRICEEYISTMGYIYDENSPYDKRLIVPFFEEEKLVYLLARDITGESKLRYKNPPKLDSKSFVLNIDKIEDELVIFEGAIDALSLNPKQIGTAMLSADLGTKQIIKIMNKGVSKIIYVPDSDKTGAEKMNKNISNLFYYYPPSVNLEIFIYNIPKPFKDFNELKMNTGKDFISYDECEVYKKLTPKPFVLNKKNMEF